MSDQADEDRKKHEKHDNTEDAAERDASPETYDPVLLFLFQSGWLTFYVVIRVLNDSEY